MVMRFIVGAVLHYSYCIRLYHHYVIDIITESQMGKLAAERWRQRTLRQIYDDFCAETSFSALTRIHKASHMYKRILWLMACLVMLAWLTIQIVWLFNKYFR